MRRCAFQFGGCVMVLCALGPGGRACAQGTWPQYAGGADRTSTLHVCEFDPASLASPAWIAQNDSLSRPISFVAQQCPMVSRRSVFAIGSVLSGPTRMWRLYSFNRRTGVVEWESPIPAVVADSWSSAAIDERQNRIVIATGQSVTCFDVQSGGQIWQCWLSQSVVNASPCITQDRPLKNRVFITDYDGAGAGGHLYCINLDQYVPGMNPYQPGQIVWTAPLNGTSGNTPAYRGQRVYVTSTGEYQLTAGTVQAFDVKDGEQLWSTQNEIFEGYYGGVGILQDGGKEYVLASSYAFWGDTWAADTEKIDAVSGQLMWSTKTNRSACIPVALDENHLLVSGGIQGFGTTPTIQLITDKHCAATTNWTSLGLSRLGGWSTQPIFDVKNQRLYVGELPLTTGSFGAGIRMHVVEVGQLLENEVFDEDVYPGFGSTPAIAGRNLYSMGSAGLHAFGPTPVNGDVNDDGFLDVEDLYAYFWTGGFDVDGDGQWDAADLEMLNILVRGDEERAIKLGNGE